MDNERGFTLIELLIVLAIMGMLVGITALSLGDLIGTTETTTMNAEMGTVQTAIDVYNTQRALGDLDCTDPILVQADLQKVTPADPVTFGRFVRRATKYFYTWEAGGANLQVFASAV